MIAHQPPKLLGLTGSDRSERDVQTRLKAKQMDPGELVLIVGELYGAALRGFFRALPKAPEGDHA